MEEEEEEELWNRDYEPPKKGKMPSSHGFTTHKVSTQQKSNGTRRAQPKTWYAPNRRRDYLVFSGLSKNPEVYLQWEDDMEEWLHINRIPKEKKLAKAVSVLTEDAYAWWLKEGTPSFYKKPILDWGDLQSRMYQEFVEKFQAMPRRMESTFKSPVAYNSKSKKVSTSTLPKKVEQKKSVKKKLKEINVSSSATLKTPPTALHQDKCSSINNFNDQACYRCHKIGHYAVTCSLRNIEVLEEKIELSETNDSLIQSELLNFNSSIIHLSLPKEFDTGLEEKVQAVTITKDQRPRQDNRKINEEDMVMNRSQEERVQILIQLAEANHVRISIPRFIYTISWSYIMHLFLPIRIYAGDSLNEYKAPELVLEQARKKSLEVVPAIAFPLKSEADQGTRDKESLKEGPLNHTNNAEGVSQVSFPMTQFVSHDATSMVKILLNLQEHEETNCLKSKLENQFAIKSLICYKCQGLGHIAKACPTKILANDPSLEPSKISFKDCGNYVTINCPNASISHLSLPKDVDIGSGVISEEAEPKENAPSKPPQRQNVLDVLEITKCKPPMKEIESVLNTFLLKEEPPDSYQSPGKYLESQKRMKPNLLSVGTGKFVLRTKPLEGGGNDEDIQTNNSQNQLPKDDGYSMPCSRARRGDYKPMEYPIITKNVHQSRQDTPEEADIQGSSYGSKGEIRSMNQSYQPNQKELGYESSCSRNLTHQGITSKKNRFKSFPDAKVIQLSSRWTSHEPGPGAYVLKKKHGRVMQAVCAILHNLEVFYTSKEVPKQHLYLPKLSRYKGQDV